MSGDFFVMLDIQYANKDEMSHVPMVDEEGDIEFYETMEAAKVVAEEQPLGVAFGFEVFEIGCGEFQG